MNDAPAWAIERSDFRDGWLVRVNGNYITDAETGEPSLFNPPREITDREGFEAWQLQLKQTIERLSGRAVTNI